MSRDTGDRPVRDRIRYLALTVNISVSGRSSPVPETATIRSNPSEDVA